MSTNLAIAGASGFVGQRLIAALTQEPGVAHIRGLSRSKPTQATSDKVSFTACDLFSLKDVDEGLKGIDEAIYLVHSMLPSSELAQGNFADYDLILADNFARACVKNGVKRVLYLSGIIPKEGEANPELLSQHLKSRLEVEKIFQSYNLPLVSLRAGIIMGTGGSSFEMILRLVDRLPAMVCPAWTQGKSNPIHVDDVCASFRHVLTQPKLQGIFDLAGPEQLSYFQMIRLCAQHFGKQPLLINIPAFSPKLSRLWVSTITGAPANLVYPLIESLKHEMVADPQKTLFIPGWTYTKFSTALEEISDLHAPNHSPPKAYTRAASVETAQIVQSVQRIALPPGYDAEKAAQAYTFFLNLYFKGAMAVHTEGTRTTFYIRTIQKPLLVLEYSKERSTPDRVLFYIRGGLLDRGRKRARLEFRQCRHEQSLIVAIHDFSPRLPWYIYKYTQAIFHLGVMRAFGSYLKDLLPPKPGAPL
ncbi:MAG: NAD-dependent epimerase/dehydratase family protein [Bdellovibrionales bacterium]|nr:NAD-dependent epimerase/dehydratase family protein [Bdellovibrionales bacterium]